ncbi:MAG: SUMF1/EgtB/PvdO family nonheme iron enzyme [Desulfobacterales bacterium]
MKIKSGTKKDARAGEPIEIKPVSFRPGRRPRKSPSPLKWFIVSTLGALLVLLSAAAWFVFTARQVVIHIDPQPEKISIEGGLAAPKIGAYYLMRPGEYTLEATRQCFELLAKRFVVSGDKSQELTFSMAKLPGRLSFQAHRSGQPSVLLEEARVSIDGREINTSRPQELRVNPGRRVVEIRAERYQNLREEIVVQGCDIHQKFDYALVPAWSDITIDSIPDNATVLIDGKTVGSTPTTLELLAGNHNIELKLERFKPWRTRLAVDANRSQVLDTVRLQPADGTLALQTNPSGANIMLSNTFAGQTPTTLNLSADTTHLIQFSKAGYETETREVTVASAASKTLTIKLTPRLGIIHLVVAPADAELIVNGKPKGKVPRQLRLLAVEHRLEIKKKGYQTYRTRITPRPGFPQEIAVTLVKQASAEKTRADTITAKNGYALKLIQPRSFTMGSSRREQGRRSNETLRRVKLQRPFYMGLREVTNKEFRQFLAEHNSGALNGHSLNRDTLPVVEITWEEAALFCNWLSVKESLPPVYVHKGGKLIAENPVGVGYRLPTEAEWEYSARFSNKGSTLKYPWGDKFPPAGRAGNFADISAKGLLTYYLPSYNDGYAATAPPKEFEANPLGLYDMGGNVAEWTHDYYSIYPYSADKTYIDPLGPDDGKHHVVRGAGWKQAGISELRLSYRDYSSTKRSDLGFRVCRYLK